MKRLGQDGLRGLHPMVFVATLPLLGACGPSGSAMPPPLPPDEPLAAGAATDAPAGDAGLYGHFRHVGGQADLEARDAAIDAAAEELPSFARSRASERLKERSTIPPEMTIAKTGSDVSVDFAGKVVLTAPLGGKAVAFNPPDRDVTVQLSFVMRGQKLVQTMQGDNGGTRRVYTPQPGGKLVVKVTIYSEKLPKNVVYDLHYALDDAPATAEAQ